MTKALVIVFVKNNQLGKVKTRLAKSIGNIGAFEVYKELVKITENAVSKLEIDKRIYFSNFIEDDNWSKEYKTIQKGTDLGERMRNAFVDGFESGYERIVLIGSDLPDIEETFITKGINALKNKDVVFGPAEDGGYYLVGMNNLVPEIFTNKPWSQPTLLQETLQELQHINKSVGILEPLNDIDTYEDLITSSFYKNNLKLQEKIEQLND